MAFPSVISAWRAGSALLAVGLCGPASAQPIGAPCQLPLADVNDSGATDVLDVQCVTISALFLAQGGAGAEPPCLGGAPVGTTDLDCSGGTDVADVLLTLYDIFGVPLGPALDGNADGCPDACQTPEGPSGVEPVLFVGESFAGPGGALRVRPVTTVPPSAGAASTGGGFEVRPRTLGP
jgi:hypothetical protein